MSLRLRPWQSEALARATKWLCEDKKDHRFLINAAPGAGKTIASCVIARELFERDLIDRVIVIAPRSGIVNQWAEDFRAVTGRAMTKVTGRDGDINALGIDICATWSAVQGLQDGFQMVCKSSRTLVVCDEHHHAAVEAVWGRSATSAFCDAAFALVLTGTPIRSDGSHSIWLAYDDAGVIDHPGEGTYTLTYGDAVELGYCRPIVFHRHQGHFSVALDSEIKVQVSGGSDPVVPERLKNIPGLQRALNFYRLACTPQYDAKSLLPKIDGFQGSMIEAGVSRLDEIRLRMPNAGGLVIAHSIEMANYMVELLEMIDGERPILVHSEAPNSEARIKAFKNNTRKWIVSVAMISEGVDIPRLRVMVYLPYALTELSFRQAMGRVVRTMGYDDDSHAYVVMPNLSIFEEYALRVEEELIGKRLPKISIKKKRCGTCGGENDLASKECVYCGSAFSSRPETYKTCDSCGTLNKRNIDHCVSCGASLVQDFEVTLDQALRNGAIVRGMDLEETEVIESEDIAENVRAKILRSGDDKLISILQKLPEQSWARLRHILG